MKAHLLPQGPSDAVALTVTAFALMSLAYLVLHSVLQPASFMAPGAFALYGALPYAVGLAVVTSVAARLMR